MMKTMIKGSAAALVAALAFASPAQAGQCSKAGSMSLANAPTMPKGVTDTIIGAVDLGPEIGVDGRMQVRSWVAQDGTRRYMTEVVADNVQGLDRPRDTGDAAHQADEEPAYAGAPAGRPSPVSTDTTDENDPFADD